MAGTVIIATDLSNLRTTCTEKGQLCIELDGTYVRAVVTPDPKAVRYCALNIVTGGQGKCCGMRYTFWLIRFFRYLLFPSRGRCRCCLLKRQ
jgi:hypothetical protein